VGAALLRKFQINVCHTPVTREDHAIGDVCGSVYRGPF
jgi:hypothetical protein